ncbi:MAG: hypothetical protein E7K05_13110, partial [Serratia marcescens]|nr:hypothetical protein [Serratia marcescens]
RAAGISANGNDPSCNIHLLGRDRGARPRGGYEFGLAGGERRSHPVFLRRQLSIIRQEKRRRLGQSSGMEETIT